MALGEERIFTPFRLPNNQSRSAKENAPGGLLPAALYSAMRALNQEPFIPALLRPILTFRHLYSSCLRVPLNGWQTYRQASLSRHPSHLPPVSLSTTPAPRYAPQTQSIPMTESSAQKPVRVLRAGMMMTAVKVLCAAIAVSLTSLCLLIFRVFTPLALDYPFRRAGESAEFPPLGTLPFYVGCAKAFLAHGFIIAFVIAFALAFTFRAFTVSSWRSRFLASLAMLILLMTISASYDIHQQMQWYRAHPTALHPRHPKLAP